MSDIKKRKTPVTYVTGGWQAYEGPGLLMYGALDYDAASSSCVITGYDGFASTDIQIYTRSSDTDAGTTVPIGFYTDGDLPAGTSTANVKNGIPFAKGLFINKTGDTTHQLDMTLLIKPLIRKSVNVTYLSGSAGSGVGAASVFVGPGILHGIRITSDILTPTTADFLIKDSPLTSPTVGTGSGNTILTKTNYGYAAPAIRPTVTLTNSDEGGSAVTTAATGAYASYGLSFLTGLNVSVQQSGVQGAVYQMDFLIEA